MPGKTYRLSIIFKGTKRKTGDSDAVIFTHGPGGARPRVLFPDDAGSSGDRPTTFAAISQHIAQERARAKVVKAQEKVKDKEMEKDGVAVSKSVAALIKLKGEIKADKLPSFMKEDNALNKLIAEGKNLHDVVSAAPEEDLGALTLKKDEYRVSCAATTKAFKCFK